MLLYIFFEPIGGQNKTLLSHFQDELLGECHIQKGIWIQLKISTNWSWVVKFLVTQFENNKYSKYRDAKTLGFLIMLQYLFILSVSFPLILCNVLIFEMSSLFLHELKICVSSNVLIE